MTMSETIMLEIAKILQERRHAAPETSYAASLYAKGMDEILKKIGEEASELIIAGKGGDAEQIIYEMADLWFHTLVLLAAQDLSPEQVFAELSQRFGQSGHAEKAARKPNRK